MGWSQIHFESNSREDEESGVPLIKIASFIYTSSVNLKERDLYDSLLLLTVLFPSSMTLQTLFLSNLIIASESRAKNIINDKNKGFMKMCCRNYRDCRLL